MTSAHTSFSLKSCSSRSSFVAIVSATLICAPRLTYGASTTLPLTTFNTPVTITLPVHAGDMIDLTVCWDTCGWRDADVGNRVVVSSGDFYTEMDHPFSCEPARFKATIENQWLTAYVANYVYDPYGFNCCYENGTLGITVNAEPRETDDEKRANQRLASQDTYMATAMIVASEAIDPVRARVLRLGSAAMTGLATWRQQLALDPPDTRYSVIEQPIVPILEPIKRSTGISRDTADAMNAWLTNIANQTAYIRALVTAINRSQGAADASDLYWETQQLQAAAQYAAKASALASKGAALRATLAAAMRASGFQTVALTEANVDQAKRNLLSNGLSTEELDMLRALGSAQFSSKTGRYMAEGRLSGSNAAAVAALGSFPALLESSEWAALESDVVASYAQLATRNGVLLLDTRTPYPPTFTDVTATSLTVVWAANESGAMAYSVQRGATSSGPWAVIASDVPTLSVSDAGRAPSTVYHYRVRATDSTGVTEWSRPQSVATLPPPPSSPPGAPTLSPSAGAVLIEYTAASGATKYKIERAQDMLGAPGTWMQTGGPTASLMVHDNATVTANTQFWYRIRGTNSGSDGPYSEARSCFTPPDAPSTPTFTDIGPYAVTANWTAPSGGAASYKVERYATSTRTWTQIAAGLVSLSYTDANVAPNITYSYRVRATNAANVDGSYSSEASVTTPVDPSVSLPSAPSIPTYSYLYTTQVYVTWTATQGAVSYKLEQAPDASGTPGAWTQIAGAVAGLGYVSSGLTANTTYWFRVRATNGAGDGLYSGASTVTTLPGAPSAPTLTAVGPYTVTSSWTAPSGGATSYKLERGTTSTGPWTEIAAGLPSLSYSDTTVAPNVTYWYRVRATNAANADGSYSSAASVTTQ